jgi:hypothetical protein
VWIEIKACQIWQDISFFDEEMNSVGVLSSKLSKVRFRTGGSQCRAASVIIHVQESVSKAATFVVGDYHARSMG